MKFETWKSVEVYRLVERGSEKRFAGSNDWIIYESAAIRWSDWFCLVGYFAELQKYGPLVNLLPRIAPVLLSSLCVWQDLVSAL
tara:strand:+ start:1628 stop:1879 length:252 start_codon:yes stop_codon:yes gene_type:complete